MGSHMVQCRNDVRVGNGWVSFKGMLDFGTERERGLDFLLCSVLALI